MFRTCRTAAHVSDACAKTSGFPAIEKRRFRLSPPTSSSSELWLTFVRASLRAMIATSPREMPASSKAIGTPGTGLSPNERIGHRAECTDTQGTHIAAPDYEVDHLIFSRRGWNSLRIFWGKRTLLAWANQMRRQ